MIYVSESGVQTKTPKIARRTTADLEASFEQARNAPDAIRRVFIFTYSLRGPIGQEPIRHDLPRSAQPTHEFPEVFQSSFGPEPLNLLRK